MGKITVAIWALSSTAWLGRVGGGGRGWGGGRGRGGVSEKVKEEQITSSLGKNPSTQKDVMGNPGRGISVRKGMGVRDHKVTVRNCCCCCC